MRRLREVRRGGLGLIAIAVGIGCIPHYDQSWRPSFKKSIVGRELVAMSITRVGVVDADLKHEHEPTSIVTLPAGARLKIVKAIHEPPVFLNIDAKNVYAVIVGEESKGLVHVANYAEDPTRLTNLCGDLMLLPPTLPPWLDLAASPPSSAAADVATLENAIRDPSDDATPAIAAHELLRRTFDPSRPDHLAARESIVAFAREGEPYPELQTLYRGFGGMTATDRLDYISLVHAATQPAKRPE